MNLPPKNEVLTIPSAITATGVALVVKGSFESDPTKALMYTAAGRALDLVDGPVARATGRASDFGAKADAVGDKIGMGAIAIGSLLHKRIPAPAIGAIVAHNSFNAFASIADEILHPDNKEVRPSTVGKVGLFVENVGVLAYLSSTAVESKYPNSQAARLLKLTGHTLTTCGVGLGVAAGVGYVMRAAAKT